MNRLLEEHREQRRNTYSQIFIKDDPDVHTYLYKQKLYEEVPRGVTLRFADPNKHQTSSQKQSQSFALQSHLINSWIDWRPRACYQQRRMC